jgi:RHS repeat-associated protein
MTQYVWDGDDLAMELDASGNTVREYTYYPGVDAPQSVRRSSDGATFYYVTEQPGHVAALVNVSNAIVNSYEYTPFGEQVSASEQVTQPLRYMGREYDSDSKLYYVRARYYDPQLGRFLSEDPIGLAGGMNPYAYVGNDPVNFTDPSGLCPECEEEQDPISHIMSARAVYPGGGGSAFPPWGVNPPATTPGPQQNPRRPGSGGGPGPQRPNAPQRTPDECFRENTSWIRSEGGKILGVGVGAIGTALTGGGVLAKVQGAQWITQGTIDLDIFFGTKRPPSSLLQRGMSLGTDGRSMIRVGSRLLRGGTWTLAAGATFLASYLGTTKFICSVNPDYGL